MPEGRDDHVPRGLRARQHTLGWSAYAVAHPAGLWEAAHCICNAATASDAFAVAPRETVSSSRTISCRRLYVRSKHSGRDCFFLAGRTTQPAQAVWNRLQAVLARHWAGPSLLAGGGLLWEIVERAHMHAARPAGLPCPACPAAAHKVVGVPSGSGGGGGGVVIVVVGPAAVEA